MKLILTDVSPRRWAADGALNQDGTEKLNTYGRSCCELVFFVTAFCEVSLRHH